MTLLHQAAQKAVEAARVAFEADAENRYPGINLRECRTDTGYINPGMTTGDWNRRSAPPALQQQEVPREPVARQDHRELMLLAAADLESWMKSYHRDGATESTVKRLRDAALAASPSTTQQQEAGNGRVLPHPGSPEASAMLDSLLAEYQWPANSKNAARAGWEAANRWLAAAPSTPESAEKDDAGGVGGNDGR